MIMDIYKMYTQKIKIKHQFHYNSENLVKPRKLETRNTFIYKKSYKCMVIYFTRYHPDKSTTMLSLHFD